MTATIAQRHFLVPATASHFERASRLDNMRVVPRVSYSETHRSDISTASFARTADLISHISSVVSISFLMEMQRVPTPWIETFQEKLASFSGLAEGWDTYDAPRPARAAISSAWEFLEQLWNNKPSFEPTRIAPTVDGSIVISFLDDETRANIEFFDSGEIAAMISKPEEEPHIWGIDDGEESLYDAIERFGQAFEGRSSS